MKDQSAGRHVEWVQERRLMNSEYQRGFMEGQHEAVKKIALCIDQILEKHNDVCLCERLTLTIVKLEDKLTD